ncbi:MAG: MBL fold metallo-hydrolase [Rhizobiales bacterium]|nr:MBL fold metallo-hydrolase [Hyphomicrobiales bacterium]
MFKFRGALRALKKNTGGTAMKKRSFAYAATWAFIASAFMSLAQPASAQQTKPGIERMYVLYCGDIALNDASSFTPGASGPGALTVTCYLIKHARGWVLFDTGVGDHIIDMPNGQKSRAGVWSVKKTLQSQLAELGLKPSEINYVALSHSHGDHVGNLNLFPQSTLVVQKAEYEWKPPLGVSPFKPGMKAITPDGDHDLFNDRSVVMIATHGHSPGHQNLLVRLPKTGAVMLTGDSVHTKANWDGGRVPKRNFNVPQSLAALERMRAVLKEAKAQLWIGHETSEVPLRKYAPAYYD